MNESEKNDELSEDNSRTETQIHDWFGDLSE